MHFLEDPNCDLLEYMPMPDFSTGGEIIYRREEMERIIETGLGSFQIRSRWRWVPEERIIEVYEICLLYTSAASSRGWREGKSDYAPFVTYMLGIIDACYRELANRLPLVGAPADLSLIHI